MDNQALTNIIGYAAAAVSSAMFFPQAYIIWKTKETKAVSLLSFCLLTLQSALWFVYGLFTNAMPIILVNIIVGSLSSYIVYMKLKYK